MPDQTPEEIDTVIRMWDGHFPVGSVNDLIAVAKQLRDQLREKWLEATAACQCHSEARETIAALRTENEALLRERDDLIQSRIYADREYSKLRGIVTDLEGKLRTARNDLHERPPDGEGWREMFEANEKLLRRVMELEAILKRTAPLRCPNCGDHIAVDEDGCCACCGSELFNWC